MLSILALEGVVEELDIVDNLDVGGENVDMSASLDLILHEFLLGRHDDDVGVVVCESGFDEGKKVEEV